MDDPIQSPSPPHTKLEKLQLGLFWSWNLIFLAFMSLGFAPIVLPETFTAVRTGLIPVSFLGYALVLALIPVTAVILGLTVLRRAPARLFALGYVIEGPLMLILAVRFLAIRQVTPGPAVLIGIALLGMAAFLWYLLDRRAGSRRGALESVRLAGLTLMVLTSLYAAVWIAFYALPLGVEGLRALWDFIANLPRILRDVGQALWSIAVDRPLMLPFSVLGFLLLLYTASLFVLTPLAVPFLSLRAWWHTLTARTGQQGWPGPALLVTLVVAASAGLFLLVNRQPQAQAFARLEQPPATMEEARDLLASSASIRAGLLNAYLAPFRYISAEGEVRHISDIYAGTFRMPRQKAFAVQRLYEGLASPLLYKPVRPPDAEDIIDNRALADEPQQAARLYQRFFDTPITEAERPIIVRAVRSTWSASQAEAAWLAVDDREVHLVRQELAIQEHGDWAELELHEAYQNQTAELQEVVYYFHLPESAVLTGVWLGDTPNKADAFSYQIAPRGAAQAVYREQTRVQQDPALLEQIGPRQYRLRVYPIPAMNITFDSERTRSLVEAAPHMHLWLAWRQMAEDGGWSLPQLAYLRNVYWDRTTERLVNGQPLEAEQDQWLPRGLAAGAPQPAVAHRVDLPGGQTVLAIPAAQTGQPGLPAGLQLAVVVDRSYSMQPYAEQVQSALEQLKAMPDLAPVDVYLTASAFRGEQPSVVALDALDPQTLLYMGGQNAAQLIVQFDAVQRDQRSDRPYDAVIVLTDGTGYELGASEAQVPAPAAPLWVVHLGGAISLGYDDQTLQAIQTSGGGVAASLQEALARLAVALDGQAGSDPGMAPAVDLLDGYLWTVLPTGQAAAFTPGGVDLQDHPADDPFAALAARRLVLAEMQRQRGTIDQLATLDALHALAQQYGIVTPYSSMIVLVNRTQQQLLDRLSQLDDRYQREVEALAETTPRSGIPLAGVPEPHEWLLLGLGAALLVYLAYSKRSGAAGWDPFRPRP